jgi:transposase
MKLTDYIVNVFVMADNFCKIYYPARKLRTRGTIASEYIGHQGVIRIVSKREAGFKARCWVVERTHSWMNRFRRVLTRWEKKPENYLSLLHFVCAIITYRCSGLLG